MTFDELIKYYGSQSKAARAINIRPVSVHLWKEKGVPAGRQAQYELLTNGTLRADPLAPIVKRPRKSPLRKRVDTVVRR